MIAGRKNLLLILYFSSLPFFVFAQKNKSQLQKERQQNLERIKETEKILEETAKEKKRLLESLPHLTGGSNSKKH